MILMFRLPALACLLCGLFAAQGQRIAAPVMSLSGGTYGSRQSVALSDATTGAALYYTTDGSAPTTHSFLYSGPIPVHQNLTINALAVVANGGQSPVATETYRVSGLVPLISTLAAHGVPGYSGDHGAAAAAELQHPVAVKVDRQGNVYIADCWNSAVRKVSPAGVITTIAGTGVAGFGGDNGPATDAQLNHPAGLAIDGSGNVFIADASNNRVRKVSPAGIVTTVAGDGNAGFGGDDGPATGAELSNPVDVALDASGNLFIDDADNNRVRRVTRAGLIATVAGSGRQGFSGDGGMATEAALDHPSAIALDLAGGLYIADFGNHRVRKVAPDGLIATVAGNGTAGFSGDGGPAIDAALNDPAGVAADAAGNLYLSDGGNDRIRVVAPDGAIWTVAGSGSAGFDGDGAPARDAKLFGPNKIGVDAEGNVYLPDTGNERVRTLIFGRTPTNPTDTASVPIFGTGFVAGGPGLAPLGTPDGNFSLISCPSGPCANGPYVSLTDRYPFPEWIPNTQTAQWIGPDTGGNEAQTDASGTYDYRESFDLTGFLPDSVVLSGSYATDNTGFIQLNGVTVGPASPTFMSSTPFTLASGFQAGVNTIDFLVTNITGPSWGTNPSGLFVELSGTAELQGAAAFGTMTFAPAAAVLQGTSQAVTIVDTLAYSAAPPTGAVAYVLSGVSYPATCTTAGSPAICTATVPAATIAALPASSYVVTGSFAGDADHAPATASSGTFNVAATGACAVPTSGGGSMNIAYYTVAESDRDVSSLPSGISSNYVLPGLGPHGLPVYNPKATALVGSVAAPYDLLADGEITWWSPALNGGGAGGASDVVETGTGVVSLPFANDKFFPPNGAGASDLTGFQAAVLTGTLVAPAAETVSFTIASDDMAFLYLDGQIACDDGGLHRASSVACTTSTIAAGPHTLSVFYVDLDPVAAVLDFSVATSNVSVDTPNPLEFGAMTFSPSASVPRGANQAITIGNTLAYTGAQPTGAVTFVLNGVSYKAICTSGSGPENCSAVVPAATIRALPVGHYMVAESFAGDCNHAPATAASGDFTVTQETLTFGTMTFSPAANEPYGASQIVTIDDTLTFATVPPTGAVTYVLNGATYPASCTGTASPQTCSANVPSATVAALPVAGYPVTGSFAGDANYTAATASPGTFTITSTATTTTLAASSTSLTFGQSVTLTATVSTASGVAATGDVTFFNGTAALKSAALNANSAASVSSTPAVGVYPFTASYGGSADDLPSASSPPLIVRVDPAPSVTTLTSSLNPAPGGASIAFTVVAKSAGGTPAGLVTLADGTAVLAVLALNPAGTATFSTSSLAIGIHNLTASYAGSANFAASQGTLTQAVLAPPTFTITPSGPLTLVTQHHGPIAIAVTPVNEFSGTVTLHCGALPPYATCEWAAAELTSTSIQVAGGPASVQLVIDTSAVLGYESSSRPGARGDGMNLAQRESVFAGLLFPALLLLHRRRRGLSRLAICSVAMFSILNLSGCGVKNPNSTPPGTYTILIDGTSGTIHSTGTLTLIVTN
jgi:hypothetical protein